MEGYTTESMVLAIAPKVPALLSLGGSMYIVWSVLSSREKKSSIYHRLMLGLSCSDILSSHIYFLGTWLIPKGSSGPFGDVFMAFGTEGTCSYSGFFNQLAVASPLYNVSLSIYYMLRIQRGWRENFLKKVEPLFHIIPLVFALGTSITAAIGEMYGNVFWTCWINPDPPQPYFQYFQWSFLFGPVWICIMIQLCVMTTLWWTMRKQERLIARKYALEAPTTSSILQASEDGTADISHSEFTIRDADEESQGSPTNSTSHDGNKSGVVITNVGKRTRRRRIIGRNSRINESEGKYSSRIAVQGALYVAAFCICWFFPTVSRITELAKGKNFFAVQALDTTLLPLQGFFNVLIYLRPRYMTYRRKYPDLPTMTIFKIIQRPNKENNLVHEFREKQMAAAAAAVQRDMMNNNHEDSQEGGESPITSSRSEQEPEILECIPEEMMESGGSSSQVHVSVSFSITRTTSRKSLEGGSDHSATKFSITRSTSRKSLDGGSDHSTTKPRMIIDNRNAITISAGTATTSNITTTEDNKEDSIIMRIDMGGRISVTSSSPERESTDSD